MMAARIIEWTAWRSPTFSGARATLKLPAKRRTFRDADVPEPGFVVADAVALGRGTFDVLLVAFEAGEERT